jgi:hypothetical protein
MFHLGMVTHKTQCSGGRVRGNIVGLPISGVQENPVIIVIHLMLTCDSLLQLHVSNTRRRNIGQNACRRSNTHAIAGRL